MCNDAHYLLTGYAKYGKEVLSRLANTGKYEIAELAAFGEVNDPKCDDVPWTYYANSVGKDHPLFKDFSSNAQNEFGSWRFERTCLDFKPDIVWDIRDPWMISFEHSSPFRKFYHWAIMPTVDSGPQQEDWLDMFHSADSVLAYSNYGKRVLEDGSSNNIKVCGVASPGVDLNTYSPVADKKALRSQIGFNPEANIIGTIMRNQTRKLYPDLFESFKKFIDLCYERDRKDLANNTYLYAHCSYPDAGWEIPQLLKEHEISHKVVFTYVCHNCNHVCCNFFRGPRSVCSNCNSINATLPNTVVGLTPEQLSTVFNIFDAYIQYAICEGFGMPQAEAAACGLPIMTVDYSAMEDIIENCGAIALPVKRMFRDVGTQAYRALPDNEATAEEIFKFASSPNDIRRIRGRKSRLAAEKYYDWDRTAKIWEDHFDSIELTGLQGRWDYPIMDIDNNIPNLPEKYKSINNCIFVNWVITNVLKEPKKLNTRFANKVIRDLNFGAVKNGRDVKPFKKEDFYNMAVGLAKQKYECEMARTGRLELENQDYLQYAHERDEYLRS
jgi:glycosyltransferase involved in cell wall biosynthesis